MIATLTLSFLQHVLAPDLASQVLLFLIKQACFLLSSIECISLHGLVRWSTSVQCVSYVLLIVLRIWSFCSNQEHVQTLNMCSMFRSLGKINLLSFDAAATYHTFCYFLHQNKYTSLAKVTHPNKLFQFSLVDQLLSSRMMKILFPTFKFLFCNSQELYLLKP